MNERSRKGQWHHVGLLALVALIGGCGGGGDEMQGPLQGATIQGAAAAQAAASATTVTSDTPWTESYGEADQNASALAVVSSVGGWAPVPAPGPAGTTGETAAPAGDGPAAPPAVAVPDSVKTSSSAGEAPPDLTPFLLRRMDPTLALADQDWRLLCDGQQVNLAALPESGLSGVAIDGTTQTLKFGKVSDPGGGGAPVFLFRAQSNNQLVGGAPRCEGGALRTEQALPRTTVLWHAFSIWIEDWSAQQDIMAVTQWFHGLVGSDLNPPFAIVVSGPSLWVEVRHASGASGEVTKADLQTVKLVEINDGSFYGRWLDIAIQAKVSPLASDGGFMNVFINGRQVASYQGPIGYAARGALEQPRHGVYPLVRRVPFDTTRPGRNVYLRSSSVLRDPEMSLRVADLFSRTN